ncbi:MAG: zf-HC2 domain-containing protein [Candidatus Omnitrophica bacterium]|nr:zf-HC2 domain-containing protein [Candidatus Omnitrophota bacterium]
MYCKKIHALINSYIDGELPGKLKEEIRLHLESCPGCKQLEQDLRALVIKPLKESSLKEPPADLWFKIKAAIEKPGPLTSFVDQIIAGINIVFPLRKPVLAFAATVLITVIAIVLAIGIPYNSRETTAMDLAEQAEFIYSLDDAASVYSGNGFGLGTAIEEFLL